jgi:uncharacterized coiled-coil DUF342 family protein
MVEHLLRYIDQNSEFNFIKVLNKDGDELFYYTNEDQEENKSQLSADYEFLQAGNYKLRIGRSFNASEKQVKYLPFTIQKQASQTAQPTPKNTMNTFSLDQVEKMVREAEQRGFEKAKYESIAEEVAKFKAEFNEFKTKVAAKFDELDGVEDNDILGKTMDNVSKIAPHLPAISESLKSFSFNK